jgi:ABC-2 type transport system permease protein
MIGRIALREVKGTSKILIIFGALMIIYSAGMVAVFPVYRSSMTEQLEGANRVHIELPTEPQGNITLTWDPMQNATSYTVWQDNRSNMLTATPIYSGTGTSITFPKDFTEKRYYAVMAQVQGVSEPVVVGIATTEVSDPFQGFLDNPVFKSFTGGRSISYMEVKGFISFEFFVTWTILVGMFIAYLSVAMVAGDFENRYMDILLSKPITRRRYLIEKFTAMTVISLILTLTVALGLIVGLSGIGSLNELPAQTVLLALIGAIPILMVITAVGILSSVAFQKVKAGMGIGFAFVFAQIFMRTFGTLSKNLELLKTTSIFEYWDYGSVIFDNIFKVIDFIGLTVLSILILAASILALQRKDIPT